MKRFLLCMLLCSSISMLPAALMLHAPAQGQLMLGDNGNAAGIQRGIIMNTLISNPDFVNEANTVKDFLGLTTTQQIPFSYQQIMQMVQQSTNAEQSIAVIEAFEKTLMHQYHYDNYLVGTYHPWQSIFFTGIKYSWMNPVQWINPMSWISNKDQNLDQILTEMAFLARSAHKHSIVTSNRIFATIESYRHWKRNIALTIIAYLTADACKRGLSKSSLYDVYAGGLSNTPVILEKVGENLCSGACFTKDAASACAGIIYAITKPVINTILYGMQPTQTKSTETTTPKNSGWNFGWNRRSTPTPTEQQTPRWRDYFKDTVASYAQQVSNRFYAQPETKFI